MVKSATTEQEKEWELLFDEVEQTKGIEIARKATNIACKYFKTTGEKDWRPAYERGLVYLRSHRVLQADIGAQEYDDIIAGEEAYREAQHEQG